MLYDINGLPLESAYNIDSSPCTYAYDIDGNEVYNNQKDPYLPGRLLIFEDDFEGNSINPENWGYEVGHVRGKSYEAKWPDNAYVENGVLVVTERQETRTMYEEWPSYDYVTYQWISGGIFSRGRKQWVYGRFEAKMKLPLFFNGAFWFMGNSFRQLYVNQDGSAPSYSTRYAGVENINNWAECGEIDCVESWSYTQKTQPQCNLWSNTGVSISHGTFPVALDTVDEWHIYAIEKTPTYIAAFIDGIEYKRWTYSDYSAETVAAYVDKAISIIIGIGIGNENDRSRGDAVNMYVDWVRVYAPEEITAPVLPESVYIQNALSLPVGYRTYMNPIIMPLTATDMTVTWESDDPTIVRCEYGGYIYAESVGETDVYVVTHNNIRCKCHITVTAS